MLKKIIYALIFFQILTFEQLLAQTPQCGGSGGSAYILPSTSNVNLLVIYAYFPSGGESGTDTIPSFANTAAQHLEDYYDEMSYDTHHLNVTVFNPGSVFQCDFAVGVGLIRQQGTNTVNELFSAEVNGCTYPVITHADLQSSSWTEVKKRFYQINRGGSR